MILIVSSYLFLDNASILFSGCLKGKIEALSKLNNGSLFNFRFKPDFSHARLLCGL